jgi:exodeoxyribonuclease VII large subunit
MENLIKNQLISSKNRFQKLTAILDSLSPLKVVERGYSLVTFEGELIKKSEQLKVNDHIKIQLMKGQVTAKVTEIQ